MIEKKFTRDNMADLLRSHGINPTHQRIEIAYALFGRQEHLSADQIMSVVNDRHCETSKATVYNTLNLFKQHNLVREVIVDPSKVFYDPNTDRHHHFYNLDTGVLTDISETDVQLLSLPDLPEGTIAAGIDVIIRVRNQSG